MYEERRIHERRDTRECVRFELGGLTHYGTIRNLSQRGCMIEAPGIDATIGGRCEIKLVPGYVASGRVAWQLGEAVGISFHLPVPQALVSEYALDDWPLRAAGGRRRTGIVRR